MTAPKTNALKKRSGNGSRTGDSSEAIVKIDDVIKYSDLVSAEGANLQRGMNYRRTKAYSVFLMSIRPGAPYADAIDPATGALIYEGHDVPRSTENPIPKLVDQPLTTPGGGWTENGKFFRAAKDFKSGLIKKPELVKVYEKIKDGVWSYKGFFELIDAKMVHDGKRNIFKFHLIPVEKKPLGRIVELPHTRLIPTHVKVEVWKRDGGKCVQCGSTENLHYDHDIPFSKGGSSLTAENVRLLCAKHNLSKGDKIMGVLPWVFVGASAARIVSRN
jgi:hypothetical protein